MIQEIAVKYSVYIV